MSSNTSCGGGGCDSCACSDNQTTAAPAVTGIGASYRFGMLGLAKRHWGIVPLHAAAQVDAIVPHSPAHNAGLMVDDSIVKIDATPIDVTGADDLSNMIELLMGAEGTPVVLTIQRVEEGKWVERQLSIVRGAVAMPDAAQSAEMAPETAMQLGNRPKCRACPDENRAFKCPDCPNPIRVARARARALAAEQNTATTASEAPRWVGVEEILKRAGTAMPANRIDANAVEFAEARMAHQGNRKAVEDARNTIELVKAWFALVAAIRRYRKARRALDQGSKN